MMPWVSIADGRASSCGVGAMVASLPLRTIPSNGPVMGRMEDTPTMGVRVDGGEGRRAHQGKGGRSGCNAFQKRPTIDVGSPHVISPGVW